MVHITWVNLEDYGTSIFLIQRRLGSVETIIEPFSLFCLKVENVLRVRVEKNIRFKVNLKRILLRIIKINFVSKM